MRVVYAHSCNLLAPKSLHYSAVYATFPVWASKWGFHVGDYWCEPGREQRSKAPGRGVDVEMGTRRPPSPRVPSPLTAQPCHTHASEPRRVNRDILCRSCSPLPVWTVQALSDLASLPTSHRLPTQHAKCTPMPLTALEAQHRTRPWCPTAKRSYRPPPSANGSCWGAPLGPRANTQKRSSQVEISSIWHRIAEMTGGVVWSVVKLV